MKARVTACTNPEDKAVDVKHLIQFKLSTMIGMDISNEEKSECIVEFIIDQYKSMFAAFAGRNAGICYMADSYDSDDMKDEEKCIRRFKNTMKSTHHSVADHCKITVLFEQVPKIFAMLMNSFQDYATSEKSARYTVMENLSEKENELYTKWKGKLYDILIEREVSPGDAEKLAMENARYFISIFSPSTTFSYTTSLRQWNYINQWFRELMEIEYLDDYPEYLVNFAGKLRSWLAEFVEWFEGSIIYNELIKDPKSRRVKFLPELYPDSLDRTYITQVGDMYSVSYHVSFSCLAHLHRHRTIKYIITDLSSINGEKAVEERFFIPALIKDNPVLSKEWYEDMESCKEYIPQGTMVSILESGSVEDFLLKCDERLCGRAQYETMRNVSEVLKQLYFTGTFSPHILSMLKDWFEFDDENMSFRIKAKCEMRKGGCSDKGGCIHGPKNAMSRDF